MRIGVVDYGVGNIANVMRCLEYVSVTESIVRVNTHKDIQECDKIILPGVGAFSSAMEHLSQRGLHESVYEYAKSGRYMLGICLGMQLLFEKSYEFGEHKGLGLIEGFVAPFGSKYSMDWYVKADIDFKGIKSKKDILARKSIAHTCNYDRNLDSNSLGWYDRFHTQDDNNFVSNCHTNIQTVYAMSDNKVQNMRLKIPHIGWNKNFIKTPHALCSPMKDSFYLYFVHSYHVCCDINFIIATCDYGISFPSIIEKENILGIQPHPERSHEMGFKLIHNFLQLR